MHPKICKRTMSFGKTVRWNGNNKPGTCRNYICLSNLKTIQDNSNIIQHTDEDKEDKEDKDNEDNEYKIMFKKLQYCQLCCERFYCKPLPYDMNQYGKDKYRPKKNRRENLYDIYNKEYNEECEGIDDAYNNIKCG